MPRYYFHLTDDDGSEPDETGMEFSDLQTAKRAALDGLRFLLTDLLEFGEDAGEGRVDITGCDGTVYSTVFFSDALLHFPREAHESAKILHPHFFNRRDEES